MLTDGPNMPLNSLFAESRLMTREPSVHRGRERALPSHLKVSELDLLLDWRARLADAEPALVDLLESHTHTHRHWGVGSGCRV